MMNDADYRSWANDFLKIVLRQADVDRRLEESLQALPFKPALILGGGKAGAVMARKVAEYFPTTPGVVAVPYGEGGKAGAVELQEAAHPLPDLGSVAAVERAERYLAETSGPLLFLLSGGASAMLGAPIAGLSLEHLREITERMLASGLPIERMNIARRHLTRWGGGKLALLAQRRVHALVVSDVVNDRLETIGSGPLAGDEARWSDAISILEQLAKPQPLPPEVLRLCEKALRGEVPETVAPTHPAFQSVDHRIILSNGMVVEGVRQMLEWSKVSVLPFQGGEIGSVAADWCSRLRAGPGVWIAGGEPTVNLKNNQKTGQGGRNQHLALLVAQGMGSQEGWFFCSIATDGVDGNSEHAGAWVTPSTAKLSGLTRAIESFNSADFCGRHKLAFSVGPTGTNVADIQIGISVGAGVGKGIDFASFLASHLENLRSSKPVEN